MRNNEEVNMAYQKHVVTAVKTYVENGNLYMDFSYQRSRLNCSGEVGFGPITELKRITIEKDVVEIELVKPKEPSTRAQRLFRAIRPQPHIVLIHTRNGTKYLPVTDVFATRCLFEQRGLDNMWVVENPKNIQVTSTFS